jgi:hypothetical protein
MDELARKTLVGIVIARYRFIHGIALDAKAGVRTAIITAAILLANPERQRIDRLGGIFLLVDIFGNKPGDVG